MNTLQERLRSYGPHHPDRELHHEAADRIDADAERIKALEADAERYRWLRERYSALTRMEIARGLGLDLSKVYVNTAEKFDAAIDAARSKT